MSRIVLGENSVVDSIAGSLDDILVNQIAAVGKYKVYNFTFEKVGAQ